MVCAGHTNLGPSTLLFMTRTNHMLHTECSNGAAIDCIFTEVPREVKSTVTMLSVEEAVSFVTDTLNIASPLEKKAENPSLLLEEIIKRFQANIPWQNVSLLAVKPEGKNSYILNLDHFLPTGPLLKKLRKTFFLVGVVSAILLMCS